MVVHVEVRHAAVLTRCMLLHMQTSFEDKDTGQVLSAVDCYFQCQVRFTASSSISLCVS